MSNARGWKRATQFLALASLCVALMSCGISGGLRTNPGYARFGVLSADGADREFALSLGPLPLKIAKVVLDDDPELSPLLQSLKAVRVYMYEVEDGARVREHLDEVRVRLQGDGWNQILAVREDGESVAALVRPAEKGTAILGFALVLYDDSEVTLVNIIGDIKPESVAPFMADLDIDLPAMTLSRNSRAATAALDAP